MEVILGTFAPLGKGFKPTGRFFVVLSGSHKGKCGEAYKFLTWGGVSIRLYGFSEKELCVCTMQDVLEISSEEYQNKILEEKNHVI